MEHHQNDHVPITAVGGVPPLLTVAEASSVLGVGRTTIYKLFAQRQLLALKVLGSTRVSSTDVRALIERQREAAVAE